MPVAIKDLLETKDMPTQLGPLMSVGGLPVGVQLMGATR